MQKKDGAVLAALVIGLLVGAAATYAFEAASLTRTTTTTVASPPVISTVTTTVTSVQTGQAIATVDSTGLRLSTSLNATVLSVGQELNISVSVFNTLPTSNVFFSPQKSFDYSVPGVVKGNWTFYGVPVSTWTLCGGPLNFDWPQPIEVVVLSGNLTAEQLPSTANTTAPYHCVEGGAAPEFVFYPYSDVINLTGFFSASPQGNLGLFPLASHFTLAGYWNVTSLAENNPNICEPAVPNRCAPPPSVSFIPGIYTVGVADEWGQFNVLHFQVSESG